MERQAAYRAELYSLNAATSLSAFTDFITAHNRMLSTVCARVPYWIESVPHHSHYSVSVADFL
jgi:hypothetical protein